jgi:hypothetical protein
MCYSKNPPLVEGNFDEIISPLKAVYQLHSRPQIELEESKQEKQPNKIIPLFRKRFSKLISPRKTEKGRITVATVVLIQDPARKTLDCYTSIDTIKTRVINEVFDPNHKEEKELLSKCLTKTLKIIQEKKVKQDNQREYKSEYMRKKRKGGKRNVKTESLTDERISELVTKIKRQI